MKPTPLSQLATISAGQAAPKDNEFSDHGTPFVRAGSLGSLLSGKPESGLELVSDEIAKLRKLKTYPKGTILFAKSGMSATKDRIYILQRPAYVVSHLATLIPNSDAHADFLRLALRSFPPSVLIKDPAYPAISLGDIQSYTIPVPEQLGDQIRIAHLLGKVEGLIAQRKQHLQQLDDLLKSVFLEMFGDPVRNEKGWKKRRFGDLLVEIESGKSPKCETRPASGDEWGVLKLGAVTKCSYDDRENKALPENVPPSVRDEVQTGDLLFSRKNTYELVAACAYVFATRPGLLMPDLIFRFVFRGDAEVNPIYMWKLLTAESQRKTIQSLAAGAAGSMPNISKSNLREVQLPIPPLPLQERFVGIVEKVEGLKSHYQQSLTDLDALYGTLSQQAFKGELDLSRVSLPTDVTQSIPTDGLMQIAEMITPPELVQSAEPQGRDELLARWFQQYLANTSPMTGLRAAEMLESAWQALQTAQLEVEVSGEEQEEEEPPDLADYDVLKALVFKALDAGELLQTFDDDRNRVALKRRSAESGTW